MAKETIFRVGNDRAYTYSKDDSIGSGAFGIVYRAETAGPGGQLESAAVKAIRLPREFGDKNLRSVLARWEVLIGLEHENLVSYYQIVLEKGIGGGYTAQIAMNYCPDGDLAQLTDHFQSSGRKMPLKMFLDYAQQMVKGLAFLHQKAIFHPDVKPHNLLVTRPKANVNMLKICDLDDLVIRRRDISYSTSSSSKDISKLCGTFLYMSPEMLNKYVAQRTQTSTIGRKSNIWSAGCVIQQLAMCCVGNEGWWFQSRDGKQKIKHDKPAGFEIVEHIIDGYIPYIGEPIPPDLAHRVMKGCFAANPSDRFTAVELNNELVAIQQETYGTTWGHDAAISEVQLSVEDRHSHRLENEEFGADIQYEYEWRQGVIGQGGFGSVYKAKVTECAGNSIDIDTGVVAIKETELKVPTVRIWKRDGSLGKVKDHWRSLLRLRHDCLVSYHKVKITRLVEGTRVDFVMDYCEGGSLNDLILDHHKRNTALSVELLKHYATQITSGLRYLHSNHILHGDIKPGNILLKMQTGGQYRAVVGDFDGSLRLEEGVIAGSRQFKALKWTVSYMSPEMAMTATGRPEPITYSTDIWSLGCVILDLADCCSGVKERWYHKPSADHADGSSATGIRKEDCAPITLLKILTNGYFPYVSELIPKGVAKVVDSCFFRNPSSRPTTGVLMDSLDALRM